MLSRENLRRRHECRLVPACDTCQERIHGDHGLAAAHIALQQAIHRRFPGDIGGNIADGWAIIENGNCRLGLFEGHIDSNLLNFRGADVFALAEELKKRGLQFSQDAYREPDGSMSAEARDPDGNVVYFNTFPEEQVEFVAPAEVKVEPVETDEAIL